MFDDDPFPEPFGPEYAAPKPADCPNCPCCTQRLCERGATQAFGCITLVADEQLRDVVAGCPCSAATTPGTAAHRAAQIRAAKRAEAGTNPTGDPT